MRSGFFKDPTIRYAEEVRDVGSEKFKFQYHQKLDGDRKRDGES